MTPPHQESPSYLRIVLRRWWLLILLPVVTVVVILALSSTADQEYQASIRLQILPVDAQEVSLFAPARAVTTDQQVQTAHDQFWEVLRLRSVAWATIADLGLNLSADDLLARIESQHVFDFITVYARMPTPELAQQVASSFVENALTTYRNIRARPAEISRDFIDAQLLRQTQELAAAREALQKFQLENELSDLNREIAAYQDLRRVLRGDRDRAQIEAQRNDSLAAQYTALAAANDARAADLLIPQIAQTAPAPEAVDAEVETDEVVELVLSLPSNEVKGGAEGVEATPDPTLLAEAESLRVLARTQRRTADEHTAAAAGHRAAIAEYDRLLAERQQELVYLLGLQERYDDLAAQLARAQATYNFLSDKASEAQLKLEQGRNIGYLQVVEPSRLPETALPQRTLQLLLVGVFVSLLMATVLAFVLEALERGLSTSPPT